MAKNKMFRAWGGCVTGVDKVTDTSPQRNRTPYVNGYIAWREGKRVPTNPHPHWLQGWMTGKQEAIKFYLQTGLGKDTLVKAGINLNSLSNKKVA